MKKYIPAEFESKWQKKWKDAKVNEVSLEDSSGKKNFYLLVEFTYPSGDLHMGHWFAFAVPDILARLKRMQGYRVFAPNGFDAFGLPAENAAIKHNIHPKDWTFANIEKMKQQFGTMGGLYDWEHQVITCEPQYYKWNQWIFLKMYEKGLAYRGKALANWCPVDQCVLANENVEAGKCWRCGAEVVQKEVDQWFFKITDYADRLLWPEKPNFILLHGFTGAPDKNFFPWLYKELVSKGYEVEVPALPDTDDPDVNKQADFVAKSCKIGPNTIILGHSLGSAVGLKIAENAQIRGLVLAAGFAQPGFKDKERPFEKKFDWKFDFEKIKANVGEAILLRAKNDTAVPVERSDFIKKHIGGKIVDFRATDDHITGEQEPEVLKTLVSFDKASAVDWPQAVREGQNSWIGKSEGVIIKFKVKGSDHLIDVFTTRPDTLWGATFLVLAPELELVSEIATDSEAKNVAEYRAKAAKKSELERKETKEKTGVFTGAYAINPINGEEIPVWIADYALAGYGTGSLFGDAHDERDVEFAKKYGIALKPTLITGVKERDGRILCLQEVFTGYGILVNSGQFSGLTSNEAKKKIVNHLIGQKSASVYVNYHLHDWSISRQRYWGAPIPIIYCDDCGVVPVPEKDLPVELPYEVDYTPKGKPPLATAEDWVNVKCPNCGKAAKREVETMDTFVDSSWYFLRYLDPKNEKEIANKKVLGDWMPVDIYFGGGEHTLGHTLYSRFFVKFLKDIGVLDFDEYAQKRVHHGVILGSDGARMSKSRGNVVNPDEQVSQYGADAVRLYLAFLGPYDLVAPWVPGGLGGVYRFLERVWGLGDKVGEADLSDEDRRIMHKTIKKVGEDIENIKFNTAVAALMEWLNHLSKKAHDGKVLQEEYRTMLLLLAPFAPHMTEELWQEKFAGKGKLESIHSQSWPTYDEKLAKSQTVTIVVQVDGKVRDKLLVEAGTGQSVVEKLAMQSERVTKYLGNGKPQKLIFVPDRLINLVV